jgi:threonine synthase
MNNKFHFSCVDCGKIINSTKVEYLCNDCESNNNVTQPPQGVLKTEYNFSEIKARLSSDIFNKLENTGFIDLLPIKSIGSLPYLKVGNTPLYKVSSLNNKDLGFDLFLKDDSQNPTFSFKDRASAIVSAYAKENNIDTIVAASTGNAGSSLAGICASQKQRAIIFVPATAPKAKLTQIMMYGAQIVPVNGTYDTAFDLSIEITKKYGWYNRNTAFNPLTIEGKKTVSYELYSQLDQTLPDRIFVPVGDGVIISGVYKGFEDLLKLGIIKKIPTIVAVQAFGSSNIVNNIHNKQFVSTPSKTIADSISVDIPRNYLMAKKYLLDFEGETILVNDDEIIAASKALSSNTGIFTEPAAATAFAGVLSYYNNNKLKKESKNVVMLTGSGLKDLNAVQSIISIPSPVNPTISDIERFLNL